MRTADIQSRQALPDEELIIQPAGRSLTMQAFGDQITFLLTAAHTQGKFSLFIDETPPGGGLPPHFHLHEDELFFVLQGRASFYADGKWTEVEPGSVIYAPRGSIHAFRNAGDTPLRRLIRTSPSGLETFVTLCAEESRQHGALSMERILQISAQHGIHFVSTRAAG